MQALYLLLFFPEWIRSELTRLSISDSLAFVTRLLPLTRIVSEVSRLI
jgi:hypothetical protein